MNATRREQQRQIAKNRDSRYRDLLDAWEVESKEAKRSREEMKGKEDPPPAKLHDFNTIFRSSEIKVEPRKGDLQG